MTTAFRIGKGTMATASTNMDTAAVGEGKVRFVKAVTLCNVSTAGDPIWASVEFAGTSVINKYILAAPGGENTITIPFFDQVMSSGERITGVAEAASSVHFYVSGREIDVS